MCHVSPHNTPPRPKKNTRHPIFTTSIHTLPSEARHVAWKARSKSHCGRHCSVRTLATKTMPLPAGFRNSGAAHFNQVVPLLLRSDGRPCGRETHMARGRDSTVRDQARHSPLGDVAVSVAEAQAPRLSAPSSCTQRLSRNALPPLPTWSI